MHSGSRKTVSRRGRVTSCELRVAASSPAIESGRVHAYIRLGQYSTAATSLRNWSMMSRMQRDLQASECLNRTGLGDRDSSPETESGVLTLFHRVSLNNRLDTLYRIHTRSLNEIWSKSAMASSGLSAYEDESATGVLLEFDKYARKLIAARGVKLLSSDIREWVSQEDQDWKQLVVHFVVKAESDAALSLWDVLSEELHDFIDAQRHEHAARLHELLSVTVRWR
jgi:hypothetical protein